jgi:hypothetical protein
MGVWEGATGGPPTSRHSIAPQVRPAVDIPWLGRPEEVEAPPSEVLAFHVNFGVPEEYAEATSGRPLPRPELAEDPADWNGAHPK